MYFLQKGSARRCASEVRPLHALHASPTRAPENKESASSHARLARLYTWKQHDTSFPNAAVVSARIAIPPTPACLRTVCLFPYYVEHALRSSARTRLRTAMIYRNSRWESNPPTARKRTEEANDTWKRGRGLLTNICHTWDYSRDSLEEFRLIPNYIGTRSIFFK